MLFHRRRNRRARSCWVRHWLSAERRLQYGHYDRLLAELRIEAFFNFMRIPPEMLSARHFLTAISSCFATYLTLNTRLKIYLQLERAGNVVRAWYELLGLCEDVART